MSLRRALLPIGIVAASAGCIFFVDTSPSGDSFSTACAVADETSACGACIAASCADELSACCGAPGCRDELAQFDECADAGACIVDESDGTAKTLAQCLGAKCSASCAVGPASEAGSNIGCTNEVGGSCFCDTSIGANTTRCDDVVVQNGVCCADIDWPAEGTSCSCEPVKCESQIDGCMCSTSANGNTSTCDGSSGTCCSDGSFCTCSTDNMPDCDQFTTVVASCDTAAVIGCDSAQRVVANCSEVP